MNLGGLFDLDALEEKIAENEARMAEQGFWDDQEKAQEVIAENNDLKAKFETFHELAESISDLGVSLELLQEIPDDEELQAVLEENYQHAEKLLQSYQLNMLLSEKYDKNNAILDDIPALRHSGAHVEAVQKSRIIAVVGPFPAACLLQFLLDVLSLFLHHLDPAAHFPKPLQTALGRLLALLAEKELGRVAVGFFRLPVLL